MVVFVVRTRQYLFILNVNVVTLLTFVTFIVSSRYNITMAICLHTIDTNRLTS